MNTVVRCAVLIVLATLIAGPTTAVAAEPSVLAFTEAPSEEPPASEPSFAPGQEPAVIAPPAQAPEDDLPWTADYLAPLLVVGGIAALAASFAFYLVRIRGRYRVVD